MRRRWRIACGGLIGLLFAGLVGGVAAAPLACDVTSFAGQVTKTGLPLTVRGTDGKERAISAGPGLAVIRNGATVGLSDVREGDQVNVTIPAGAVDCAATRIEATTAGTVVAVEKDRTGLWGLLGLLGLAGLIPLLRERMRPSRHAGHTAHVVRDEGYTPTVRTEPLPVERAERSDALHEADTRPIRR